MRRDLTREQLQTLTNLSRTDDGRRLIEMLEAERHDAHERLEVAQDPATLHRLQGRAQFLKEFKEMLAQAPTLLEKTRR